MCRTFIVFLTFFIPFLLGKPATFSEQLSHMIFPGTNWCGIGSIAKDYNDLGYERDIDKCCRAHDKCPREIDAGENNFGLYNKYFISRLHCSCDEQFYNCLKNVSSPIGNLIGNIYFNILQYPCFAKKCPQQYLLPWGVCTQNITTKENTWYDILRF